MTGLPPDSLRDLAVEQVLPHVSAHGWTVRALAAAGWSDTDVAALFPSGAAGMVEAFCDLADRRMAAAAAQLPADLRTGGRLRAILAIRLAQHRPYRAAVGRAAAILGLPRNLPVATRCTYRTVDTFWAAAGDRSVDLNWYTKRATLAGVYGTTLLFWLRDDSSDDGATLAFFDRRVADVARLGRLRRWARAAAV